MIQMLVVAAMTFGVQSAAIAQFGGLLKKAKKALNIEVTTGDSDESTTSSESSSEPSTSVPKKLKDLNPEMFIYQPVDDPVNPPFYDINDPRVKQYYDQFCGLNNRRVKNPTEYYWLFEFLDYQSPAKGLK